MRVNVETFWKTGGFAMAIVELSKTILEWSKNFGCSRRRNIPRQPFDSRSQVTVEMATKNRFVYSLTASSLCTYIYVEVRDLWVV